MSWSSSLLKKAQPARYGVKNALKMLMYSRVHCAFSGLFASSRTRLRLFQQAAKRLAAALLLIPFFAPGVLAEKGDYILGGGVSVDDDDGVAAIVVADFGVAEQTWLSTSFGRNSVELPRGQDLETLFGEISIDHYWGPAGVRFGVAYWGDSDILDSTDWLGAIYTRGDKGRISVDVEYRDLKLRLPPIDLFVRREIPFHAAGLGLSGGFRLSERTSLRFAGMNYEYNVEFRAEDSQRFVNLLLSNSRLSLLTNLIDWRASAGIALKVGSSSWQLDVATWRGAIDRSENRSITGSFLTPMTNKSDIEFSLGLDQSDLYGEVLVLSVFVYFYGGN